jgi:hypothetical protein
MVSKFDLLCGRLVYYCYFPLPIILPLLLPVDYLVTKLIVHRDLHLIGLFFILSFMSYSPQARDGWENARVQKNIGFCGAERPSTASLKKCFDCRRFRAKPVIPLMSLRLLGSRLRLMNRLLWFDPDHCQLTKRWEIIFTCLMNRVVRF